MQSLTQKNEWKNKERNLSKKWIDLCKNSKKLKMTQIEFQPNMKMTKGNFKKTCQIKI